MTNNSPKASTTRRRRVLSGLLVIFILAGAWVAYFLANFDLNNYREYLEEQLSSRLSLPARIDDIQYNFHEANLALHLNGLQLGDEKSLLQINVPDTMIDLQWRGLFVQEFRFIRISLAQPEIWVRRAAGEDDRSTKPQMPFMHGQAILYNTSIGAFSIVDGTVHIDTPDSEPAQEEVLVTGLSGEMTEIHLNQLSRIALDGEVQLPGQGVPSSWRLLGDVTLNLDDSKGLTAETDLQLDIRKLDLNALNEIFARKTRKFHVAGRCDLKLQIEGPLRESVDFQILLSSDRIEILPDPVYTMPVSFRDLLVSGRLLMDENQSGIKNLSLKIDETDLAGDIEWAPPTQPFSVRISLADSHLTVPQLKQWLPDTHDSWRTIRKHLLNSGQVQFETVEIQIDEDGDNSMNWRLNRLKGEIQTVAWQFEGSPELEIRSLPFDLEDGRWRISDGLLQMGSLEIAADGHGEYGKNGFKVASLDFTGEALPEHLLSDWYIPQRALVTEGKAAISGHIQGPVNQLAIDLQADLSHLYLNHPAGLKLTPDPEDKLNIHATLSQEAIVLDHGSIKWSAAKGHISGSYLIGDPDSLALEALLTIDDLTRLADSLPLLDRLQLHGQAELSISQRGRSEANRPTMTLTLRDAGLRATRHIADLKLINGRINVTPDGLDTENLRIHLGESPLTVKATLADFTNPRLSLDVKGPTVRAQDVVFYSDQILLRDLDGHLEIDREGLLFAPVDVRLDGGTRASVNGTIDFRPPYPVKLDITSDFALISEVINLWTNRAKAKQIPESNDSAASAPRPRPEIRISAHIKEGDLYGMAFHDASGVIVPTRDRLVIHPLDFSVGEGYCNAQVLTDFVRGGPSRLRISGHAEDVDALEVYRELLNQENIVRGVLRGDFYLTGDIGSNFLPSSFGRFSIQIRDGVLHQFPVLSKVFSLLNVSQIFALQLPDMDLEGMPFESLTANFQLDKGILKSEDLTILSEAMNQSYTGQVDLVSKQIDMAMAIHPLGTVDKIVSKVPVIGWLLTGEDKALLTAHFSVSGKIGDVSVMIMPLDTLTEPTIGLLRRTLGLPFKLIEDPQILWGGDSDKE